jgi:hypothetical protein
MPTDQPKISLSYNPVSGEFTIKVTNTTRVSYTLEYDWENLGDDGEPNGGTEALINTEDANASNIFQDTKLAGTESSNDKFVHTPKKGIITLSADTLDDKVLSYQSSFKITEAGSIKTITEQTTTKAKSELDVLGESSASAEPTVATFSQPVLERRTSTAPGTTQSELEGATDLPLVPIAIGVAVALVIAALIGVWWFKKKNSTLPDLSNDQPKL